MQNVRDYNMKRIYPTLTVVAGVGYLTSLVLYALTFNDVDSQALPVYWPLTIGLFGIWLIAILKLIANPELKELQKKKKLPKKRKKIHQKKKTLKSIFFFNFI